MDITPEPWLRHHRGKFDANDPARRTPAEEVRALSRRHHLELLARGDLVGLEEEIELLLLNHFHAEVVVRHAAAHGPNFTREWQRAVAAAAQVRDSAGDHLTLTRPGSQVRALLRPTKSFKCSGKTATACQILPRAGREASSTESSPC